MQSAVTNPLDSRQRDHTPSPAGAQAEGDPPREQLLRERPNLTPPPGNPRFPLIDALRALAALMIVGVHVRASIGIGHTWWWFLYELNLGVPVFFAISGFLLYRPFLAARAGLAPGVSVRGFAWRRALRILPGYWVALLVLAIVVGLPGGVLGDGWWRYFGLLQAYDPGTYNSGIQPAWSLSIEAGLYVLLPLVALLIARLTLLGPPRQVAVRALQAIAVLIVGCALLCGYTDGQAADFAGDGLWFLSGMALAAISVERQRSGRAEIVPGASRWPGDVLCWLIAALIYTVLAMRWNPTSLYYPLAGAFGFFAVLPATSMAPARGPVERLLAHRVLASLGVISYGIYLWHKPLIDWLRGPDPQRWNTSRIAETLAALALTLVCAGVSYYLVERPALRLRRSARPARAFASTAPGRAELGRSPVA